MILELQKNYEPEPEEKEDYRLDLELLKKARTHEEYLELCRKKAESA